MLTQIIDTQMYQEVQNSTKKYKKIQQVPKSTCPTGGLWPLAYSRKNCDVVGGI